MCLILFGLNQKSEFKLILAANRDEFFSRPTEEAHWWKDNKDILAGRDIKSGGTWLGINKNGRFIAITNYRDLKNINNEARSRGELSKSFLTGHLSTDAFLSELSSRKDQYNSFNLLLSDNGFDTLYHYSNVTDERTLISDGIHGLSNHLLDTPWPKVELGKQGLQQHLDSETKKSDELIKFMQHGEEAPDSALPDTGISYELEKKLSPVFISMKEYGTRCSTILEVNNNNGVTFLEVTYNENKTITSKKSYQFSLEA